MLVIQCARNPNLLLPLRIFQLHAIDWFLSREKKSIVKLKIIAFNEDFRS